MTNISQKRSEMDAFVILLIITHNPLYLFKNVNIMDYEKLTITELAAYADLCEKRKVELFRDMNLYRGDTSLRNKYQDLLKVCEKLTKEIDRRLFENNDESDCANEKTLAED